MSTLKNGGISLGIRKAQPDMNNNPNENSTALLSDPSKTITLDFILEKCGGLGRFQILHYFFINLIAISAGIVTFYYVFAAADIDHRCRLPTNIWPHDNQYSPLNITYKSLIDRYIPKTRDGKKWQSCMMYSNQELNDTLVKCPNGWVYDRSVFGHTFTEQANFVCGSEPKKSLISTLMQCGCFPLLIVGVFADKYGRKKIVALVTITLFFSCLITQLIIQFVPMSIDVKFTLLLLNQFASGFNIVAFTVAFVLMLELTSAKHTNLAGNFALIAFTIGEGVVTLFAYLARDWQILKWINTAFIGLVIPYLYFMPESPLYLYSKRQNFQLEQILHKIATTNKRKDADWRPFFQELIQYKSTVVSNEKELTFVEKVRQMLSHWSTVIKLAACMLLGFTTLMVYFKIGYGLAGMSVSPYLSILIGAAVEAAGYITGSTLMSTRLARKGSYILLMVLTMICVILIPIISSRSSIVTVIIAQVGKFAISGTVAVSWIFVTELFPTSIRSGVNGVFVVCSRVGGTVAPIIDASITKEYLPYTFYALAGLSFIVIVLILFLPETKSKPMDAVEDYNSE